MPMVQIVPNFSICAILLELGQNIFKLSKDNGERRRNFGLWTTEYGFENATVFFDTVKYSAVIEEITATK